MSDSEEEQNPIETPQGFKFNDEQLQILQDHVAAVKAAENKKKRAKLVKAARKEVMELPASKGLPLERRQDLVIAVDSWFAVRSRGSKNKIKFGKAWSGRLVMYQEKKEAVNELKASMFEEAKQTGKDPAKEFNFFQKAMSAVWDGLSPAERRDFDKVAEKWNQDGVSREQKQEAAMKNAVAYTKKFAEDMYKSLGVRYLFMVAMETPSETIHTGLLDFNDAIGGGKTYASEHKNWRIEGIDLDYWNDHNREYYDPNKNPKDVTTRKIPRGHLNLPHNEYGEPILPDPLLVPRQENARSWRQNVIRAFLSKHYELASGSRKPIPWKKFLPKARACIKQMYLPDVHLETLAEPSSMRDNQCYTLLKYWYESQTAGQSPTLRFSFYLQGEDLSPAHERELLPAEPDGHDLTPPKDIGTGEQSQPKVTTRAKKNLRKNSSARKKTSTQVRGMKGSKGKGRQPVSEDSANSSGNESSSDGETSPTESSNADPHRRKTRRAMRARAVGNSSPDDVVSPSFGNARGNTTRAVRFHTIRSRVRTSSDDDNIYVTEAPEAPLSHGPSASQSHSAAPQARGMAAEKVMENTLVSPMPGLSLELQQVSDRLASAVLEQTKETSPSDEEDMMGPPDVYLSLEFQEVADRLAASRKREREGSPQLIPSSPTKKSRPFIPSRPSSIPTRVTPAPIDLEPLRAAANMQLDLKPANPAKIDSEPSRAAAKTQHDQKPAKDTLKSMKVNRTKTSPNATPELSMEQPRGSRSKTQANKQSYRRSTRANPN